MNVYANVYLDELLHTSMCTYYCTLLLLDPCITEGPIKSPLSVCPSVLHFSQEWVISFKLFFVYMMVDNWNT